MSSIFDGPKRAWWRRVTLLDVILFTLPVFALVLWLFGASVMDYHRARQFDDWWSSATSVRKFGWNRIRTALCSLQTMEVEKQLSAEREDVPQLRLLVERRDWDRIDDDVGGHWGEWIPAQIRDGGDLYEAELRFRGDGSAHWTTAKKSFTLKTKRSDLYKGHRTLAFSVKDVLPQWLVGTMAEDFGLLAPEQDLVPVFLNDRFYGIHRFVEPIDEAFLRHHHQLPGNVFRADTAERGDYFKGLPREVFKNPHIWELAAENTRSGAPGRESLEQFLTDLNGSTFADHERFMAWIDRDEISRLFAYLLVVGDPFHMSGVHNQFWYQDPSSGRLHAIPWDVRLLDLEKPPTGSNINPFWRAALKDPRVWDGTLREIAKRVNDEQFLARAERRVKDGWERYHSAFEFDSLRSGVIPPVGDPQEAIATLRKNLATLRGWIADSRVSASTDQLSRAPREQDVIDILVGGHAAANVRLEGGSEDPPPHVIADTNGNGIRDEGDRDLGITWDLGRLLPGVGGTKHELAPEANHYRFFVTSGAAGSFVQSIKVRATNAPTNAEVAVAPLASATIIPPTSGWSLWSYEKPASAPKQLSGDVHMSADLALDERGSMTIEPGTTITLDAGVSWLLRGQVTALGTAEKPITIRRAKADEPWGTIALQGAGTSGSRFAHVRFQGGGGARLGAVAYDGMVCVHDTRTVVFDECEFASNERCDDALHVARSDVEITHNHFHDVNADAIDCDGSSGTIAHNRIEGAPADGIELSGSSPRVVDNDIRDTGSRAIVVSEGAAPLLFDNRIDKAKIAIDVRDAAEPVLLNNAIGHCETSIHAYQKNHAYDMAGWPKIVATQLRGNGIDWVADNHALRTLVGPLLGSRTDDVLPPARELDWLLHWQGIRIGTFRRGPLETFDLVAPEAPIYSESFKESFTDVTNGWHSDGHATRMLQRQDNLVVSLGNHRTNIARVHDWNLSDASREYTLVLELVGENVADVHAAVSSPQGIVESAALLDDDPETFVYAVIDLPPRRYDGLLLSARPRSTRSFLRLHGYRIFAWPASSKAR